MKNTAVSGSRLIHVAIDGPAGAGKTTVAAGVARALGIPTLDTGGMYRVVALHCLRRGIDLQDEERVAAELPAIAGAMVMHPTIPMRFSLDGEDVSDQIRTPEVAMAASTVSRYPAVRRQLVALQQEFARHNSVVAEGRDIGTVVLPDAAVKVFLDADLRERARRRLRDLTGNASPSPGELEAMEAEIARRDHQDRSRKESPLRVAPGAHVIDSTRLTADEVIARIVALAQDARKEGAPAPTRA